MGVKRTHTLKGLFRSYTISLILLLAAAVLVPACLEIFAISRGWVTRANSSELQVRELLPTLAVAPDITKVKIPQSCTYLILDKEYNELYSNMSDGEKSAAMQYARGEYIDRGEKQQFALVTRENEICILQYYIGSQFTASWVPDFVPAPDTLTFSFMALGALMAILLLTARFAGKLRMQLKPLTEATSEVAKQNLDFEVGHSEIRELEEVLLSFAEMKDSLKKSLEKQWKAEQLQREQIAALAHDLKTPLTVIQGNVDLLREAELNEEQALYADYIGNSSEQMEQYIKALIEIARVTVGYQLQRAEFDLRAYIQYLESRIAGLCNIKGVRLQVIYSGMLPARITGDKLLLERAILNVISNALDYSKRGDTLTVSVAGEGDFLQISVIDEGQGFSPEALLYGQEKFFMADNSRNSDLHFGMGLYITKTIVEQHGGRLILENTETAGAKVTILLPR